MPSRSRKCVERALTPREEVELGRLVFGGEHLVKRSLPWLRRYKPLRPPFRRDEIEAFRLICRRGIAPHDMGLPVALIRHLVDCLRVRAISHQELEATRKDVAFGLGAFWGSRVVLATKHEWRWIRIASFDEALALVSPKRGTVTFPFALVDGILKKQKENTLALAYNGILAKPEEGRPPRSYTVIG